MQAETVNTLKNMTVNEMDGICACAVQKLRLGAEQNVRGCMNHLSL